MTAKKLDLLEEELAELRSITKDHERRIKHLEDSSFNNAMNSAANAMDRLGGVDRPSREIISLEDKLLELNELVQQQKCYGGINNAHKEQLWLEIEVRAKSIIERRRKTTNN